MKLIDRAVVLTAEAIQDVQTRWVEEDKGEIENEQIKQAYQAMVDSFDPAAIDAFIGQYGKEELTRQTYRTIGLGRGPRRV